MCDICDACVIRAINVWYTWYMSTLKHMYHTYVCMYVCMDGMVCMVCICVCRSHGGVYRSHGVFLGMVLDFGTTRNRTRNSKKKWKTRFSLLEMVFSILLDFCYYSKRQNRVFRGILFAVTGCVFDNGRWTAQPGTSAGPGEREREKTQAQRPWQKSCLEILQWTVRGCLWEKHWQADGQMLSSIRHRKLLRFQKKFSHS